MFLKYYIQEFWTTHLFFNKAENNNLLIAYFLNAQVVGPFSMLVYPKLVHFFEKKEADKFLLKKFLLL